MASKKNPPKRKRWDNLREELKPLKHEPGLEDPRLLVWQDVLAARRQWLIHEKDLTTPQPPPGTQVEIGQQQMQALLYKHVRKEPFTTDGMGYGEVVEDELCWYGDNKQETSVRRSQRTSSGRQTLKERKKV